jgi:hypothetical protein
MNFRMLPPPEVINQTIFANGRTYTGQPGSVIDVIDCDAAILSANGWTRVALSGPTSARPSTSQATGSLYHAARTLQFYDTSLGKLVIFDGADWRDPATGNAA